MITDTTSHPSDTKISNKQTTSQVIPSRDILENALKQTASIDPFALLDLCQSMVDTAYSKLNQDQDQQACYQLAYASAEIESARSALLYAERVTQLKRVTDHASFEMQCAMMFAAETINQTRNRFLTYRKDFNMELASVRDLILNESIEHFCQILLSADYLASLGRRAIEEKGATGDSLLNSEQAMIQGTFRRFAEDRVMPLAESIHREDNLIPDTIIDPLTELGVFGLSIPQQYGGLQPNEHEDNLGMIIVTEELSRGSLGAAGSLITRPEIMARSLLKGGTDDQKQYWLPKIAAADPLCAIAVTEPDYGSDVANIRLKATRCEGGWRINGEKSWCTFAGKAGVLLTLARTDADLTKAHKGLTQFLVEKPSFDGDSFEYRQQDNAGGQNDPVGSLTGKAIPTIGYRGMHSYSLFFDNFFVPDSQVVGGELGVGKGFYYMMAGFSGGRIQTAARATGVMQAAYEKALQYAQDRVVFGKPIADYQLTLIKLAKMATQLMVCRQFTYQVARLMDQGQGQLEASLVKLYACKASEWVCREAMQIHGGMGYSEECAVSRYYIDARVLSIFEGAEETLAIKVISKGFIEAQRALARSAAV